jgi:hypothetical protein
MPHAGGSVRMSAAMYAAPFDQHYIELPRGKLINSTVDSQQSVPEMRQASLFGRLKR